MMLRPFAADVPPELQAVDELLSAYGRWAADRSRGRMRCGSAEGQYRAPARGDDDARRSPGLPALALPDAMRVQRAIAQVPEAERQALVVLYIPQRLPVAAQLRIMRMTPDQCRERHAAGLRLIGRLLAPARS